jgi:hypothetical protein
MSQQQTPVEIIERLGASPEVARRLVAIGLEAWVLLPLDHPSPQDFVPDEARDDADDIDDLIALHYPGFGPAVLERLSRSEWSSNDWLMYDFSFFPGPINRICALAEAGVHPSVVTPLGWRLESGSEILERMEPNTTSEDDVSPVKIALGDVEFTISIDGVEMNGAAESERALMVLSGSPNQAIELLNVWNAATRPMWPTQFPMIGLRPFDDLITSSNPPGEPNPFRRLLAIWQQTMFRRLHDVAPTIPDWHTAFAEEHPNWASLH